MATKRKAAPKPAAKKAVPKGKPAVKKADPKPVAVESIAVSAAQDGATLVINGVPHTLTAEAFLGLRGDINDQAAALVR